MLKQAFFLSFLYPILISHRFLNMTKFLSVWLSFYCFISLQNSPIPTYETSYY